MAIVSVLAALLAAPSSAAPAKGSGRYLVLARSAADARAKGVATDRLTSSDTVDRAKPDLSAPGLRSARRIAVGAAAAAKGAGINPDPAWDYKGLLWDYRRMACPRGGSRRPAARP